jgi:hypothetical protein
MSFVDVHYSPYLGSETDVRTPSRLRTHRRHIDVRAIKDAAMRRLQAYCCVGYLSDIK